MRELSRATGRIPNPLAKKNYKKKKKNAQTDRRTDSKTYIYLVTEKGASNQDNKPSKQGVGVFEHVRSECYGRYWEGAGHDGQ